jgi:p-cumate 2,3-dioxygenase alpha subunit
MLDEQELERFVIDDRTQGIFRVKRSSMTREDVWAHERERIFDRCWLYVDHASEIDQAGDYVRRKVAGRPLVSVRGRDGAVRALYNSCTHRGARVCRQDSGNAKSFQCFYHAWTFRHGGSASRHPRPGGIRRGGRPGRAQAAACPTTRELPSPRRGTVGRHAAARFPEPDRPRQPGRGVSERSV